MWIFIILIIMISVCFHFEPMIDKMKTGEIIIWYNAYGRNNKQREYIIIWK